MFSLQTSRGFVQLLLSVFQEFGMIQYFCCNRLPAESIRMFQLFCCSLDFLTSLSRMFQRIVQLRFRYSAFSHLSKPNKYSFNAQKD